MITAFCIAVVILLALIAIECSYIGEHLSDIKKILELERYDDDEKL